jgi:hypothetical protein
MIIRKETQKKPIKNGKKTKHLDFFMKIDFWESPLKTGGSKFCEAHQP